MTGTVNMNNNKITNLGTATQNFSTLGRLLEKGIRIKISIVLLIFCIITKYLVLIQK